MGQMPQMREVEERDRARLGADRHRERVDDHVLGRDAVVAGGGDDLLRHLDAALRLHRDLVVVREPDDRRAVLRHERQDRLEPLVLARHRVDERLALVRGEPGLERLDHRGVDADRQLAEALHERDRLAHQVDLVGERIADVDIEHVRAALDLLRDVGLDLRQVARLKLRLERLAPGRVDPLADHAERLLRPDDDRPRRRLDDRVHSSPFPLVGECRAAGTAARCRPRGGS